MCTSSHSPIATRVGEPLDPSDFDLRGAAEPMTPVRVGAGAGVVGVMVVVDRSLGVVVCSARYPAIEGENKLTFCSIYYTQICSKCGHVTHTGSPVVA